MVIINTYETWSSVTSLSTALRIIMITPILQLCTYVAHSVKGRTTLLTHDDSSQSITITIILITTTTPIRYDHPRLSLHCTPDQLLLYPLSLLFTLLSSLITLCRHAFFLCILLLYIMTSVLLSEPI